MANEFKIKNGLLVSGSITGVTEAGAEDSAKMASTAWVRTLISSSSFLTTSTAASTYQPLLSLTSGYIPKATGTSTLTNSLIYDDGNCIGVGLIPNTSTIRSIHIHGSTALAQLKLTNTTTGSGSGSGFDITATGTLVVFNNRSNGSLYFNTNNTTAFVIDNTGSLLAGASSNSGNKFFIVQSTSYSTPGTYALAIANSSFESKKLVLGYDTTIDLAVISSFNGSTPTNLTLNPVGGGVLIGTTTYAGYTLDVNGTGRFSGVVTTGGLTLSALSNSPFTNSAIIKSESGVGMFLTNNAVSSWMGVKIDGTLSFGGAATFTNDVFITTAVKFLTGGYILSEPTYGFTVNDNTNAYNNLILYNNGNAVFRGDVISGGVIISGTATSLFPYLNGKIKADYSQNSAISTQVINQYNGSSAAAYFAVSAYGNSWYFGMGSSTSTYGNDFVLRVDASSNNAPYLRVNSATGAATFSSSVTATSFKVGTGTFDFSSGDALLDYSSASVRLRTFKVGFGYITPLLIDANTGAATFSSTVTASNGTLIGGGGSALQNNYIPYATGNYTLANSIIQFDGLNKIGIGTAPSYQLDIYNGGSSLYQRIRAANGSLFFGVDSIGHAILAEGAIPMYFYNNGAETMRISPANNLLLGRTDDNGYKLDINGTLRVTGFVTSNSGFRVNADQGFIIRNDANSANIGGIIRKKYWIGGSDLDPVIFAEVGYGISLLVDGTATKGLTIATTGAATFSSDITIGGILRGQTSSDSTNFLSILNGRTDTFSGVWYMQAGGGSAGFGGGIVLHGHSHATKPGWVTVGISAGSGGKFSVNNYGIGGGTDVFTVDASGNVVANGTGIFSGVTAGSITADNFYASTKSKINDVAGTVPASTATIIYSALAGNGGALVLVTGRTAAGDWFFDVVAYNNSNLATAISSQNGGSPPSRSYTVVSADLKLTVTTALDSINCFGLAAVY